MRRQTSRALQARVHQRFETLCQELFDRLRGPLEDDVRARLKVKAEREILEGDLAEFRAKEDALRPLLKTSERNAALHAHLQLLADYYDTQLLLDPKPGAGAVAHIDQRKTAIPFAFGDRTYASGVHEQGHMLAEPCAGPLHHHDQGKVACLRCEEQAWRIGISLALDWTETMHAFMGDCLSTYTRGTRGPTAAFEGIRRLTSRLTFHQERQRRLNDAIAREAAHQGSLRRIS
jgi:hypothetical protein